MTWHQKMRENERLIHLYMAYLQAHSFRKAQALNLMSEIGRLNTQNDWIKEMTVEDYYQQCYISEYQIQSRL